MKGKEEEKKVKVDLFLKEVGKECSLIGDGKEE